MSSILISFLLAVGICIYQRYREILRGISNLATGKFEDKKNQIEIALQPKWFLYSGYLQIIAFIGSMIILWRDHNWWSLLYIPTLIIVLRLLAILQMPKKRRMIVFFVNTAERRLSGSFDLYESSVIEAASEMAHEALEITDRVNS